MTVKPTLAMSTEQLFTHYFYNKVGIKHSEMMGLALLAKLDLCSESVESMESSCVNKADHGENPTNDGTNRCQKVVPAGQKPPTSEVRYCEVRKVSYNAQRYNFVFDYDRHWRNIKRKSDLGDVSSGRIGSTAGGVPAFNSPLQQHS